MRYKLLPYTNPASRERCPSCNKPREYTRYIDTETGELLPEEYGSCNRADKCSYKYSPYDNSAGETYATAIWKSENTAKAFIAPKHKIKPVVSRIAEKLYVPQAVLDSTVNALNYTQNNFARFVLRLCKDDTERNIAMQVFSDYKVGTCSAGTIFWFVDIANQIHAGQVKQFDINTCKTQTTTWVHSIVKGEWVAPYYAQEQKLGCLFGEHLLALPENAGKTICLVESPKNALLCSIFMPKDCVYLATYSLSAFTAERCKQIVDRYVVLIPDLGKATEVWKENAPNFLNNYNFSDIIESCATQEQREAGADIADFLIKDRQGKANYNTLANLSLNEFLDKCEADSPNCEPFDYFTTLIPAELEFIKTYVKI